MASWLLQHDDQWFATDKLGHFVFCLAFTACVYTGAARSKRWRPLRAVLAAAAGLVVGVAKEAGDALQLWPGTASARDLAADAAGVAVALALALAMEGGSKVHEGSVKQADELV